ncbi:MAG TPA: amidohydrolase family protein [Anaerolineales bacterium]|nr:amidohydrolase family protein [Anaerolineales bacterium]
MLNSKSMELFDSLRGQISALPVIDCHEHTFLPEARPSRVDLWTVVRNSDVGDDLISAGMPATDRPKLDWNLASPYLPRVRNTGFYRSLILAFQCLFDFQDSELRADNWESLSEKIAEANTLTDWYSTVLHQHGNIQWILRVQGEEPDPFAVDRRYFAPLINFDEWIHADKPDRREQIAAKVGGQARTLNEYLAALDLAFEQTRARNAFGVKSLLAYRRPLNYAQPDRSEIEPLFGKPNLTEQETHAVEDFLMHEVAERAGRFQFPYQIHVGYGSWQSNITAGANPLLLNLLIESHRYTQFVLLHGGYPFIGEMATLAKNHPNVFIETGWLAYIAPAAYRRAVGEWLDSVPMNKILAFGADCLHIEQTLGALILTRRLLTQAFADKIVVSGWSESLALECATRLLSRNAVEPYRLPNG